MKRIFLMAAFLPMFAFAQKDTLPLAVGYKCDDGKRVLVEYEHERGVAGSDRIVITRGVSRWKMSRQPAGSGERYVDAKETMEWWNKGRSGTLTELGTKKAVGCREVATPKPK